MRSTAELLQPLGRALMLPIAVLPVAGLLLRFGQPDLLNLPFIAAAGDAIFSNLGLLFAIGVAVGLAKDNNGAAGLAGAVCFLIATKGAMALLQPPADLLNDIPTAYQAMALAAFKTKAITKLSVPIGLLSGLISGQFYNRFHAFKLPDYLAFFAGRRFVPIVSGLAGLLLAGIFGGGWQTLDHFVDSASRTVLDLGPVGLFAYGVLNRLLIITGLHHILNNVAWFILGDFNGTTGDLNRFFAGDPTAGQFMSGFFPVMMFGLPAACLAMYHTARADKKAVVGGMLLSMALTAFLTGVTEPIEFTFMFLAPVLYALHAVLTGLAMMGMNLLGIHLGFSFSAGLFDYLINFKLASKPLMLLPVGAVYFALYYGLFRLFIQRFNLETPGRETATASTASGGPAASPASAPQTPVSRGDAQTRRGDAFLSALGGAANLMSIDACTTRLRLIVVDQGKIDDATLKALGARGVVRPSDKALQVVLGPVADQVASEIRAAATAPIRGDDVPPRREDAYIAALGGAANVVSIDVCTTRLRLIIVDQSKVDDAKLMALGVRGIVRPSAKALQVVLGPIADQVADEIRAALAKNA